MNIFKAFGINKEHKGVPHDDIPEFIPHPEIPNATIRNPEYKKHIVTPPGDAPEGEGITGEDKGYKLLPDTFTPEKEGKNAPRGRGH